MSETDALYRERAHLVAYLTTQWPSVVAPHEDGEADWRVIIVNTIRGQMSWHVHVDDMDLFAHVPSRESTGWSRTLAKRFEWDGHTTEQKYERLRSLTEREARR